MQRSSALDRRMAETMQKILDAADRLFAQDGYGATSMEAIALAAGVSRKTLFNYVDSRSALIKLLIRRSLTEPFTTPYKESEDLATGEFEDFFPPFEQTLKAIARSRKLMRLGVEYANLFSSDEVDPAFDLEPNRRARIIRTKALQRAGKVRADIPAADIVRHFEVLRNAAFRRWLKRDESKIEDLQKEIDQVKIIIKNGINIINNSTINR